ncbi:MAG: hypothetical protein KAS29_14665, partial [Bacteroidales bacterium]|nr:hypothetical protein [Bacteroidales bacterium]
MRSIKINKSFLLILFLVISSCASYEPFYNDRVINWQDEIPVSSIEPDYSVILLGDSRTAYTNDTLLSLLKNQLLEAGENSAVIFLGNNVYPHGLPDSTENSWDVAQESLLAQLKILEDYEGQVIF